MCAAVIQALRHLRYDCRDAAAHQNGDGRCKAHQHRPLHLVGLYLLAEKFRRPAHHQARNEHGQDGKGQHTIQPAAYAAENHLAKLHLQHLYHAAQRRVAVVHGVDGAVGGRRGEGCPGGGGRDTEAGLLALHIAAGLVEHRDVYRRVRAECGRGGLLIHGNDAKGSDKHQEHRHEDRNALLLVFDSLAEGKAQRRRNQQQRDHL